MNFRNRNGYIYIQPSGLLNITDEDVENSNTDANTLVNSSIPSGMDPSLYQYLMSTVGYLPESSRLTRNNLTNIGVDLSSTSTTSIHSNSYIGDSLDGSVSIGQRIDGTVATASPIYARPMNYDSSNSFNISLNNDRGIHIKSNGDIELKLGKERTVNINDLLDRFDRMEIQLTAILNQQHKSIGGRLLRSKNSL